MRYVLDRRYQLRGWKGAPTGVFDTLSKTVLFLDKDDYRLLIQCDGAHDMTEGNTTPEQHDLLETLEAQGYIHKAGLLELISDKQRYRTYPARYRRAAQWSITGACNLRCRHCFMSAPHAKHGNPTHEQLMNVVAQLAECGVFRVSITGGEPLMRSDFLQIVDALTQREIGIPVIFTNGWLVDERLLDELEARRLHPSFQLSFDGIGQHDFLRGVPGAEERALRALRLLQERHYKVSVSMCVHRGNAGTVRETVRALASLGVSSVKCGTMMPLGEWAEEEVRDLWLTPDEEQEVYERYIPQYFENGAPVSIMMGGAFMYTPGDDHWGIFHERRCSVEDEDHVPSCGILTRDFFIGADGMVAPCMGMCDCEGSGVLPNLYQTPLREILQDSVYTRLSGVTVGEVREKSGVCRDCAFADRCAGGCRNDALMGGNGYYGAAPSACHFFTNGWDERIRAVAEPAFKAYAATHTLRRREESGKDLSGFDCP